MSRAFVRTAAAIAGVLAAALLLAPAASAAARPAEEPRLSLDIQMHVGNFHVQLGGEEEKGKQEVALFISRRHQYVEYAVPAEFTDSTIKAKFGSLGEVDYSYAPQGSANLECPGAGTKVNFTGTFTFTGENGYIHIDADNATGTYSLFPEPSACSAAPAERLATASRAAPFQPYVGEGATLGASTFAKTTNGIRSLRALTVSREVPRKETSVSGLIAEDDHGMSIIRAATVTAPARAFEWDFAKGTANVAPSAPFSGTATFTRDADGRKSFTGSLKVPLLGIAKPVALAGAAFHATLHRGTPHED
jgi:hypothetical protein